MPTKDLRKLSQQYFHRRDIRVRLCNSRRCERLNGQDRRCDGYDQDLQRQAGNHRKHSGADQGPLSATGMEDIDIWRSADLLIKQHGDDAALVAAAKFKEMQQRGTAKE